MSYSDMSKKQKNKERLSSITQQQYPIDKDNSFSILERLISTMPINSGQNKDQASKQSNSKINKDKSSIVQ